MSTELTAREGDIVRTKDGHLWRVINVHRGVEAHPGGPR